MPRELVGQEQKDLELGLPGKCNLFYAPSIRSIEGLGSSSRENPLGMGVLTCIAVDVMRDLEHHKREPSMRTRSVLSATNTKSEQTLLYLKLGKED